MDSVSVATDAKATTEGGLTEGYAELSAMLERVGTTGFGGAHPDTQRLELPSERVHPLSSKHRELSTQMIDTAMVGVTMSENMLEGMTTCIPLCGMCTYLSPYFIDLSDFATHAALHDALGASTVKGISILNALLASVNRKTMQWPARLTELLQLLETVNLLTLTLLLILTLALTLVLTLMLTLTWPSCSSSSRRPANLPVRLADNTSTTLSLPLTLTLALTITPTLGQPAPAPGGRRGPRPLACASRIIRGGAAAAGYGFGRDVSG